MAPSSKASCSPSLKITGAVETKSVVALVKRCLRLFTFKLLIQTALGDTLIILVFYSHQS